MSSYLLHMLIFGLNVTVISAIVIMIVRWYLIPFVQSRSLRDALIPLLLFSAIRVNGLMLLIPGVVANDIPQAFATAVAYGDVVAAILALVACVALSSGVSWARTAVWAYSIVGLIDLMWAFTQLVLSGVDPSQVQGAYLLIVLMVPTLFILHLVIIHRLRLHPEDSHTVTT
ncbi:MAG: hypothetical protein AAF614_24630 [Chloroflexota bacterium]